MVRTRPALTEGWTKLPGWRSKFAQTWMTSSACLESVMRSASLVVLLTQIESKSPAGCCELRIFEMLATNADT